MSSTARNLAFAVLLAGGLLPSVDFFIVNVSLSSIRESLGSTPAETQLVVSGYAAAYAVFLITGGRLGDLYGRRRMFLIGMTGYTLTNLLCGIAATPGQLVLGRLVQGVAASLMAPQVLGSIRTLYPSERELAGALSFYGMMMGLSSAFGQFSGGALVQWSPFDLGWRAVFILKLPLCVLIMVAAGFLLPETSDRQRVKLDIIGAVLISCALAAFVVPLSEGRDQGWPLWVFLAMACVPFMLWGFVRYEALVGRHGGMPLVDMTLLTIPSFRRGVLVATLFFFTTAFYFLFGIYVQEGKGVAPLFTGIAILPYGFGLFLGPIGSAPFRHLGNRLLPLGMIIQVAFYALIGVFVEVGWTGWELSAIVFLAGFGQGIAYPRLFTTVLGDIPPAQGGVAAGINNSALQVGAAVSAAAIGSLFFSVLGSGHDERAYAHAFAVAQWAVSAALLTALLISIPRPRRT